MQDAKEGGGVLASSSSSESSEMLLSLSNVQDMSDHRVASLAEHHDDVTILFTDIVGFTKISSTCSPAQVMIMLNKLFSIFDLASERHNIYKLETIGDAYMCAAGLNLKTEKEKLRTEGYSPNGYESNFVAKCNGTNACPIFHATRMLNFAQDILKETEDFILPNQESLQIRIGVHTGDCMTGIVGMKMPRFCLFGDTVNTASRMESNGVAGRVHGKSGLAWGAGLNSTLCFLVEFILHTD
jgi:ubiquitin carboxyl-terminal hydrolase 48